MILRNLIPQTTLFFDLFESHVSLTIEAAFLLKEEISTGGSQYNLSKIKTLEHMADKVTQQCAEAIHKTFITPIDRDLIYKLISHLDDIIDGIDKTADCLTIYKVHKQHPNIIKLTDIMVEATKAVQKAIAGLRDLTNEKPIRKACADIRRHEHDADTVLHEALVVLFDEEVDARMIIKMKDIYESLESTTDRCADVADDIETILIESN